MTSPAGARCRELQALSVSDDAVERRPLDRHAADCERCAAMLDDDRRLAAAARLWAEAAPEPPPALAARVLTAVREARSRGVALFPVRSRPQRRRRRRAWTLAAAASLLLAVAAGGLLLRGPLGLGEAPLPDIVQQVRQAERAYVRAIAGLEREATTKLARAGDPVLGAQDAALLLSYQDRLAHLDGVIAEVRGFLGRSPGHAGGHTVLLAAYKEKSQLLQEVIDLRLGATS